MQIYKTNNNRRRFLHWKFIKSKEETQDNKVITVKMQHIAGKK